MKALLMVLSVLTLITSIALIISGKLHLALAFSYLSIVLRNAVGIPEE
jgi:hypothetical protein